MDYASQLAARPFWIVPQVDGTIEAVCSQCCRSFAFTEVAEGMLRSVTLDMLATAVAIHGEDCPPVPAQPAHTAN